MPFRVSVRPCVKQRQSLRLFFCPACSIWQLAFPSSPNRLSSVAVKPPHLRLQQRALHNGSRSPSIAPTTSINAPADVRPEFLKLYAALDGLKRDAGSYVNLSRLGLALRGLQNLDPLVRVALLTIGESSQAAARKLARVLLADPLGEEGKWEKRLETDLGHDGRAILLRYGDESEVAPHNPLLHTVFVPSRVLQNHGLELLITNLNADVLTKDASPAEAVLVPALQIPVSMTGRTGIVTNPVHKAIIFGDGVASGVDYGRFVGTAGGLNVGPETVTAALNVPTVGTSAVAAQSEINLLNIDYATEALTQIRRNDSLGYEHNWLASNVSPLSNWLISNSSAPSASTLKPSIQSLIQSLIDATSASFEKASAQRALTASTPLILPRTQESMLAAISAWAEAAHTELRDGLAVAFASRAWHKIKWWKLMWRVDDVTATAADLLSRHWLVEAERQMVFLGGRMEEAGFFRDADEKSRRETLRRVEEWEAARRRLHALADDPPSDFTEEPTPDEAQTSTPATSPLEEPDTTPDRYGLHLPTLPLPLPETPPSTFTLTPTGLRTLRELQPTNASPRDIPNHLISFPHTPKSYPQHIPFARAHLAAATIPPLHAAAQGCVVRAIGGSATAGGVGALVYVAEALGELGTGHAGYEAGAVAAFGIMWVLRQVQRRWEGARDTWRVEVEERGREALKVSEEALRTVVRGAAKTKGMDPAEKEDEDRVRERLRKAKEALVGVSG